jgi:hypothetical protein
MKVYWVGWVKEGTSDKLWGVLEHNGQWFNFWCRRGAKMQFKHVGNNKYSHKVKKGYNQITIDLLEQIYPNFSEEANMQLTFGLLAETVR